GRCLYDHRLSQGCWARNRSRVHLPAVLGLPEPRDMPKRTNLRSRACLLLDNILLMYLVAYYAEQPFLAPWREAVSCSISRLRKFNVRRAVAKCHMIDKPGPGPGFRSLEEIL
ncbi:hypothetical protein T310_6272, partial [Rasamsonia emersonii CBS 393.64]